MRASLAERKGEGAATESLVAKRELERYYTALKDALASLRLEPAEARLIVDALNGSEWNASNYRYLAQEIADAIEAEDLDKKWGVQAKSLLAKLRRCGPAELLSIIDAVERFWNADEVMRDRPIDERLLAVGLLRPAARNGELRP